VHVILLKKDVSKMKIASMFLALCGFYCGLLFAQSPQAANPTQGLIQSQSDDAVPTYRVVVIERTMKAVNYQHRNGATMIGFSGTPLLPNAHGEAKVESKKGYIEIEVEFDKLQPASKFGAEYLTYVLWAITPEGRTSNLGEILLSDTSGKLNVTTELQVFGLAVTAEPYFAVSMPSNLVVMENTIREDTKGKIEEMYAKYELLERGQYERLVNPLALKMDSKMPLELYEARNAVQIARATGADRFASDTFAKAENSLTRAEAYQASKAGRKQVTMAAREAVQTAEDSRAITVKRQEEERLAIERKASSDREALAKSATEAEARLRMQAEADRRMEANRRARAEAESANAQSETARVSRDADAARVAAQTEADRVKRETDMARDAAQIEADRAARTAAQDADQAARIAAQNADQAARTAAQEADRLRLKGEAEKAELRAQLLSQFNLILDTRDTARGLIINMSDVLFDTAKFSLRPLARERLAKVAGILLGHPGLKLEVEGHTDSVGSEKYNQNLSEQRAGSVRGYLIQQGIAEMNSVPSKGFGESQPVATNDTAAGRQLNRRVELIVSGELIGRQIVSSYAPR
jgi:outer membrane protein OmpA-like peptidoglycan-associated protein